MTDTFDFSPRMAIVLANIKALRDAQRAVEEDAQQDIKHLLQYLSDYVRQNVTEIASWDSEIDATGLYFWPKASWRVLPDDSLSIVIECKNWLKNLSVIKLTFLLHFPMVAQGGALWRESVLGKCPMSSGDALNP